VKIRTLIYAPFFKHGDLAIFWLRFLVGIGLLTHGYGKLFTGSFTGFADSVSHLGLPFPQLMASLAAGSEFFGGIFLALGFGTRFTAFMIFCTMSVALFVRHADDPFSIKEKAFLYWGAVSTIMITGSGKYSLDYWIKRTINQYSDG